MSRLGAAIFQHFADPAAELRYRREQRTAQVKFIRALMLIGPAMLSAYIIVNPLFVESKYGVGMLLVSIAMLPLLGFYYWYVGQPSYAGNRWIDITFFALIVVVVSVVVDIVNAMVDPRVRY